MRSGRLRKLADIEAKVVTSKDSYGEDVYSWQRMAQAYVGIEASHGWEGESSGAEMSQVTHKIFLRAVPVPLRPKMRVVYDGRIFDLKTVLDKKGRDREFECMAVENTS